MGMSLKIKMQLIPPLFASSATLHAPATHHRLNTMRITRDGPKPGGNLCPCELSIYGIFHSDIKSANTYLLGFPSFLNL